MLSEVTFKVFRFDPVRDSKWGFAVYKVPFTEGMRLLDGLRFIQENLDSSLSFRWNCREGICGSCAVRLNGKPVLLCKTPVPAVKEGEVLVLEPLLTLKVVKDLVSDVSKAEEKLAGLKPYFKGKKVEEFRTIYEAQTNDAAELRRCIHCYVCFDACHVVRDGCKDFLGPNRFVKLVSLDKHPDEAFERVPLAKDTVWFCNNSRCCSETCPQDIKVNENAMVYSKERAFEKGGKK